MKIVPKHEEYKQYEIQDHGIVDHIENLNTSLLTVQGRRLSYVLVGRINKSHAKLSFRDMSTADLRRVKDLIDEIINFVEATQAENKK